MSATSDGQPLELTNGVEAGWNVYANFVRIPSGGTVTVEINVKGHVERPEELVTWTQPLATPLESLR